MVSQHHASHFMTGGEDHAPLRYGDEVFGPVAQPCVERIGIVEMVTEKWIELGAHERTLEGAPRRHCGSDPAPAKLRR